MWRVWLLCVFSALIVSAGDSEARSPRVNQIPNGSAFSCANCHVNPEGGGTRTAFGQAIFASFLTSQNRNGTVVWNAQLAGLDSDGDGVSNGQELGDPEGDGTPDSSIQVTNPGNAASFVQPVVNRPPVFTGVADPSVKEGEALSFVVHVTDEDQDPITLTSGELPVGAKFENGQFSWTPGFDQAGAHTLQFTASDGKEQVALSIQVTVENVLRPLVIASVSPDRNLLVGAAGDTVRFSLSVESSDNPAVTYAWTVNGAAQAETTGSILVNLSLGDADDLVFASISDGVDTLSRSWTVSKVLKGDFNGDNAVSFADFLLFVPAFGKTSTDAGFNPSVDINGNGRIDFPDFLEFARFFGLSR